MPIRIHMFTQICPAPNQSHPQDVLRRYWVLCPRERSSKVVRHKSKRVQASNLGQRRVLRSRRNHRWSHPDEMAAPVLTGMTVVTEANVPSQVFHPVLWASACTVVLGASRRYMCMPSDGRLQKPLLMPTWSGIPSQSPGAPCENIHDEPTERNDRTFSLCTSMLEKRGAFASSHPSCTCARPHGARHPRSGALGFRRPRKHHDLVRPRDALVTSAARRANAGAGDHIAWSSLAFASRPRPRTAGESRGRATRHLLHTRCRGARPRLAIAAGLDRPRRAGRAKLLARFTFSVRPRTGRHTTLAPTPPRESSASASTHTTLRTKGRKERCVQRQGATHAAPKLSLRTSLAHRPLCGAATDGRCNTRKKRLAPSWKRARYPSCASPPRPWRTQLWAMSAASRGNAKRNPRSPGAPKSTSKAVADTAWARSRLRRRNIRKKGLRRYGTAWLRSRRSVCLRGRRPTR